MCNVQWAMSMESELAVEQMRMFWKAKRKKPAIKLASHFSLITKCINA